MAKLQNKDLKLESFIQIMRKTVVVKAKANLQTRVTIRNIDQNYLQNFQLAHTTITKANNQGQLIKKP